jgi:hypothetical protein
MGLDVIWRSEQGDELGAFYDQHYDFVQAVVELREREYPNLGRIDEYSTTQVPPSDALVEEVSRVRDVTPDAGGRERLSALVGLLRRAALSPGTYLEFIGD